MRDPLSHRPGYAGHVPNAKYHFGSSHVGDLPHTEPKRFAHRIRPLGGNYFGSPLGKAQLHQTSAYEIGRQAWLDRPLGTPRDCYGRPDDAPLSARAAVCNDPVRHTTYTCAPRHSALSRSCFSVPRALHVIRERETRI